MPSDLGLNEAAAAAAAAALSSAPAEPAAPAAEPAAEAAPAAEAVPAVEAEAAPAVSSAPEAVSAPETSVECEEVAAPTFPSHDEFGWDDWDGSFEALPDEVKGWGEKITGYYQPKLSEFEKSLADKAKEVERLDSLYDSLSRGKQDPRIEEYEKFKETAAAERKQLEEEYTQYKAAVEAREQEEAQAFADQFKRDHADLWDNEDLGKQFTELLQDDWDPEIAADLVYLGDKVQQVAKEAKAAGAPDMYAIEFALMKVGTPEVQEPNPAAGIVAGADRSVRPLAQPMSEMAEAKDISSLRLAASRKAIKRSMSR